MSAPQAYKKTPCLSHLSPGSGERYPPWPETPPSQKAAPDKLEASPV